MYIRDDTASVSILIGHLYYLHMTLLRPPLTVVLLKVNIDVLQMSRLSSDESERKQYYRATTRWSPMVLSSFLQPSLAQIFVTPVCPLFGPSISLTSLSSLRREGQSRKEQSAGRQTSLVSSFHFRCVNLIRLG
jgi:hypothetical protein